MGEDACEAAATSLEVGVTSASVNNQPSGPPGCFLYAGDTLYANSNVEGTGGCDWDDTYYCLCETFAYALPEDTPGYTAKIGVWYDQGRPFFGGIKDLRLYTATLSSSAVLALSKHFYFYDDSTNTVATTTSTSCNLQRNCAYNVLDNDDASFWHCVPPPQGTTGRSSRRARR